MKKPTILLSLAVIISLIFGVYQKIENATLKKIIVHQATITQFDRIRARARAFMELNYDTTFIPGRSSISGLRDYELSIRIPEDKKQEFTKWMSGYSVNAVDGYNDKNGSSQETKKGQLIYRVYYGNEPKDW
jgi:hypothetical protein